ncbi:delta-latroinsectotoxin-Lt1a-like [Diabrotica virgifera virgifera]|uniref:Uncharacterized protein n=1 Tax=Diabrotica virgifera virgifera TaxID=50390 RepID=A0ABM5IIU9_DIAVI|nr:delta-latroinsectotoxin-Lt1a-like [Diabrotica virgifera virgifera]
MGTKAMTIVPKFLKNSIDILGAIDDVYDIFQLIGIIPDEHMEKMEEILTAVEKNYEAIENVGKKVDRNFAVTVAIHNVVTKTLSVLEKMRWEMLQGFEKVLNSLEELKTEDKISNLVNFIDDFNRNTEMLIPLSPEERVMKLDGNDGILKQLNKAVDTKGILDSNLNHIINEKLAIPKHQNDDSAFSALNILYYGVQTYVSVLCFNLKQYCYLIDYYYKKGNIYKYNESFDRLQSSFHHIKQRLISTTGKVQLIDKVKDILKQVSELRFVRNQVNDVFNTLEQRIHYLDAISDNVRNLILPIDVYQPNKLLSSPNFENSKIQAPLNRWISNNTVSYALQFEHNNTYTKISEWSEPVTIQDKACPLLNIPVDFKRRTRLIFRKFNNEIPVFVGKITQKYETTFRDINRDIYNAAMDSNEELAIDRIKLLMKNGGVLNETFEDNRQPIHAAAQVGNIDVIKFLLNHQNVSINSQDDYGYTPIYIAAEAGYHNLVQFLIAANASVNVKTKLKKLTPLHIAAYNGDDKTLKVLLKSEETIINVEDQEGFTPLHSAVFGGPLVLKSLMSCNETMVNRKSKANLTALHLAAINDYDDVTDMLINNSNIQVNCETEGNFTPLHFASSLGNLRTVQVLLKHKNVNVNAKTIDNLTALHLAISSKSNDVVLELLKNEKTDVNIKSSTGVTALHLGAIRNEHEIVGTLIKKGAMLEDRTQNHLTAMQLTAIHNIENAFNILIDNGADINSKTNGSSILHLAAQYGHVNITRILFKNCANFRQYDNSGFLPIHVAAWNGKIPILDIILEEFPDIVDIVSGDETKRSSSLHLASEKGYMDVIRYLVEKRWAGINILNANEESPMMVAANKGYFDVVKYFFDREGTNINQKNIYGECLLHLACLSGNVDFVDYIIPVYNVTYNRTSYEDASLHYAALSGNLDLVKYIIDKGVNPNTENRGFYTPLTYATWYNHMNIVKYLETKKTEYMTPRATGNILKAATLSGDLEMVKYSFNRYGFDEYAFALAADYGFLDIVKFYVQKNSSLQFYYNSLPILHRASKSGNLELVKYLIEEKNVAINREFSLLRLTPLSLAILSGNLDLVKYFTEEKNVTILNPYRYTLSSLSLAVASGNLEMVKYFFEEKKVSAEFSHGCSIEKEIKNLGTYHSISSYTDSSINVFAGFFNNGFGMQAVLKCATGKGYLDIVKYFLDKRHISVDINDLMFRALDGKRLDMVKYFVNEKNVNIDIKNKNGKTFLDVGVDVFGKSIFYGALDRFNTNKSKSCAKKLTKVEVIKLKKRSVVSDMSNHQQVRISNKDVDNCYFITKINNALQCITSFIYPRIETNTTSSVHASEYSNDFNSNLLLLDLVIRKLSGKRCILKNNMEISAADAEACALNIIDAVETILNSSADDLLQGSNLDFFKLYMDIKNSLVRGELFEIHDFIFFNLDQYLSDNTTIRNFVNETIYNEINNIINKS